MQRIRYNIVKTYASLSRPILCVNFYIVFNNRNILGSGTYSTHVYPRYRKMRQSWRSALSGRTIRPSFDSLYGFVPLLDGQATAGEPYPKADGHPMGSEVTSIIPSSPKYLLQMKRRFGVQYALKETGGMYVGPEGGMLEVLRALRQTKTEISSFVDVAAGTGELSAYVMRTSNPRELVVNEISPHIADHLRSYLSDTARMQNPKTRLTFSSVDCLEMIIPAKVDIMTVGVFYGSQPTLIKNRGHEIVSSLGRNGLFILQSAMPEALFNLHLLERDERLLENWPWYDQLFAISEHFKHHSSFFIDNQFITIASQSTVEIRKVLRRLHSRITPYESYQRNLLKA